MLKLSQLFRLSSAQSQNKSTKKTKVKTGSSHTDVEEVTHNQSKELNIGKNIILNTSEKVIGYQFLPLKAIHEKLNQSSKVRALSDAALLTRLYLTKTIGLLNTKIALINVSSLSLSNPLLDKIASKNIVLVVDVIEPNSDWDLLNSRLVELGEKGFLLGLAIREDIDAAPPIAVSMNYITVDIASFIGLDLRLLINNIYAKNYISMDTQLIATNIQSHEDFQFCYRVGFNCFEGPFIAKKGAIKAVRNEVNSTIVFSVLQMLRNDSSFEEIAKEIKNEPTVTYKLLRYVNSAAMGLSKTINNLTEAVMLIGRDKLYRWISLLLFDFEKPGYYENIIVEKALSRARTLELLSGKGIIPNEPDKLFLVGLFSLLEEVLGEPLSELLERASLPEDVKNALETQSGIYADSLELVTLGEINSYTNDEQYNAALSCAKITDAEYAAASLSAIVWADEALNAND